MRAQIRLIMRHLSEMLLCYLCKQAAVPSLAPIPFSPESVLQLAEQYEVFVNTSFRHDNRICVCCDNFIKLKSHLLSCGNPKQNHMCFCQLCVVGGSFAAACAVVEAKQSSSASSSRGSKCNQRTYPHLLSLNYHYFDVAASSAEEARARSLWGWYAVLFDFFFMHEILIFVQWCH